MKCQILDQLNGMLFATESHWHEYQCVRHKHIKLMTKQIKSTFDPFRKSTTDIISIGFARSHFLASVATLTRQMRCVTKHQWGAHCNPWPWLFTTFHARQICVLKTIPWLNDVNSLIVLLTYFLPFAYISSGLYLDRLFSCRVCWFSFVFPHLLIVTATNENAPFRL